jgi:hypothetical protein
MGSILYLFRYIARALGEDQPLIEKSADRERRNRAP